MEGTKYLDEESVLQRGQEAVGIPLGKIDKTGRIKTGKGAVGTVLEESWFGYKPNNESEPDFPEAGVELKATPYIKKKSGDIRAKERLVCNIINYMTEYSENFLTSDFWHKCKRLLIMSYEYKKDVPKSDFTIDKAILFSFPDEDLVIIQEDWQKIIDKIKKGEAHLITEGDTMYLAACTKGANASSVRQQPFNQIPAKQRAYSLKSSYMTYILQSYVFGNKKDEHIVKDWHELEHQTFEEYVARKLRPYYGKSQEALKKIFNVDTQSKSVNEILLAHMLGIEGKVSKSAEFKNADILPKTIRVQANGHIRESMSFPYFDFNEILNEGWETSKLWEYLEPVKFMFVIFQENQFGEYIFSQIKFWNMPADDLEEVHKVWEKTRQIINQGVELAPTKHGIKNNLPKRKDNRVAHVRPHGENSKDTLPLPDGRQMVKQCFWLNNTYIEQVIHNG